MKGITFITPMVQMFKSMEIKHNKSIKWNEEIH